MDDSRIVSKLEDLIKLLKRADLEGFASTLSDISDRLAKVEKHLAEIRSNTDRIE